MNEIKEKATKAKEWTKRNLDTIIGFGIGGVLAWTCYKLGKKDGYLKGSADASKACYDKIMDVAVLIDEK